MRFEVKVLFATIGAALAVLAFPFAQMKLDDHRRESVTKDRQAWLADWIRRFETGSSGSVERTLHEVTSTASGLGRDTSAWNHHNEVIVGLIRAHSRPEGEVWRWIFHDLTDEDADNARVAIAGRELDYGLELTDGWGTPFAVWWAGLSDAGGTDAARPAGRVMSRATGGVEVLFDPPPGAGQRLVLLSAGGDQVFGTGDDLELRTTLGR